MRNRRAKRAGFIITSLIVGIFVFLLALIYENHWLLSIVIFMGFCFMAFGKLLFQQ